MGTILAMGTAPLMPRYHDPGHALVAGMVLGAFQACGMQAVAEVAPDAERAPGDDYLPSCILTVGASRWRVTVAPMPLTDGDGKR